MEAGDAGGCEAASAARAVSPFPFTLSNPQLLLLSAVSATEEISSSQGSPHPTSRAPRKVSWGAVLFIVVLVFVLGPCPAVLRGLLLTLGSRITPRSAREAHGELGGFNPTISGSAASARTLPAALLLGLWGRLFIEVPLAGRSSPRAVCACARCPAGFLPSSSARALGAASGPLPRPVSCPGIPWGSCSCTGTRTAHSRSSLMQ